MPLSPIEGEPDPGGADCVSCGRCCHHGPRTVHLLEGDEARVLRRADGEEMLRRLTVLEARPPGFRFLRNGGERCAALDVSVQGRYPCGIYEVRPEDCRIVEPGSPACMEARRLGRLGSSVEFVRPSGNVIGSGATTWIGRRP
jgi:Fe-S-cluster containining protein